MDREIGVLLDDPEGGLYNSDGSYGGKVHFPAKLELEDADDKASKFRISLDRPQLGHSCRFARQFGSHRFIRVNVPQRLLQDGKRVVEFFSKPFVLQGYIFRACFAKDNGVFLFQTNESLVGGAIVSPGTDHVAPDGRVSWINFIHGHNPMQCNIDKVNSFLSV